MNRRQKIAAAGALGALAVLAAVLNYAVVERPSAGLRQALPAAAAVPDKGSTPAPEADFMAEYTSQRSLTREQQLQQLDTVLKDDKTDAQTRRAAQELLMQIVSDSQTEMNIQTLLRAKGFEKVAVAVGRELIHVIVEGDQLEEEEVARILEVATREGQVDASEVKIIPAAVKNG